MATCGGWRGDISRKSHEHKFRSRRRRSFGNGGNLAVARALAKAGLPIFPAWCGWDESKQKWEKMPLVKGWQTLATTDPAQINAWWLRWPDAVAGIELGRADLVVLD
jgi:hypothetical protein